MPRAEVNVGPRVKEPIGLVKGQHIYPACSMCGKKLLDIWVVNPNRIDPTTNKPFEWDIIAHCCYCNDHSFVTRVNGEYIWGGYGVNDPEDSEAGTMKTVIHDVQEDDKGIIHVYTKRVS